MDNMLSNNSQSFYDDDSRDNSPCIPQETSIHNVRLARAYVPFEKMCETFMPIKGLKRGTIFPPLYDAYGWEKREGEE
ncbi:spore coat associated protein JA (CotJA) [Ruminiclostridium sufflavum DSM 19573]|uniref:Spore coat associated protein JA (CotJA) n=1 Tax=Ruminiclostridium sufflavum DSM 19573 TaxID=1121337 RepID=A0A318XP64_9FIRM|nr:spore coat associated protein CotJA [Ruminiclostridium sufflavum]PYG89955.1 spore coat associated protein JA (CotJA) [Ruminiclostridium sufflavum DSM 19573]